MTKIKKADKNILKSVDGESLLEYNKDKKTVKVLKDCKLRINGKEVDVKAGEEIGVE